MVGIRGEEEKEGWVRHARRAGWRDGSERRERRERRAERAVELGASMGESFGRTAREGSVEWRGRRGGRRRWRAALAIRRWKAREKRDRGGMARDCLKKSG